MALLFFVGAVAASAVMWQHDEGDDVIAKVVRSAKQGVLFEKVSVKLSALWSNLLDRMVYAGRESLAWAPEDAAARAALPEFRIIPAAQQETLTPAADAPASFRDWHRSHGDSAASHFSALDQINRETVGRLAVAWTFRAGTGTATVQSNPVIAGRLLFTATGGHEIVALDAATGVERWRFEPPFDYPAKRGMVWWPGNDAVGPRLFVPAGNRVYALDPATGNLIPEFGDGGAVRTRGTGKIAPAIAGTVLVHATTGPAAIHGFDVVTGARLWTRSLIAPDAPVRPNGAPSLLAGGNPWGGMSVDEGRGIAFVTTGNPSPVLVGIERPGGNAYSNSVVAIDTADGAVLWSFQEIAHDLWDLDLPAPPILTTIERAGQRVDVVATPTKAGNTLLLDRLTGRPVFDFRMRRAPVSTLPGERTARYQPDVELPEPFAKQAFERDDVTDLGPRNRASVLAQLEERNHGFYLPHEEGVETVFFGLNGGAQWPGAAVDPRTGLFYVAATHEPSMATVVNVAATVDESALTAGPGRQLYLDRCAACHGENRAEGDVPSLVWLNLRYERDSVARIVRHGQQAMPAVEGLSEVELDALLDYLFTQDRALGAERAQSRRSGDFNFVRTEYRKLKDHEGYPGSKPPWGTLTALDLNTGRIRWRVPLGEEPELIARGLPPTGTPNFGGPVATAGGLVFVAGTKDRLIRAFDSATGEELWRYELPFVASAPPATYEIDGRQYLFIAASGGGTLRRYDERVLAGDAFLAFALPDQSKSGDSGR